MVGHGNYVRLDRDHCVSSGTCALVARHSCRATASPNGNNRQRFKEVWKLFLNSGWEIEVSWRFQWCLSPNESCHTPFRLDLSPGNACTRSVKEVRKEKDSEHHASKKKACRTPGSISVYWMVKEDNNEQESCHNGLFLAFMFFDQLNCFWFFPVIVFGLYYFPVLHWKKRYMYNWLV